MIQGIYTATMGMTPLIDKQDQIANNLANINTTGYKQSGLFVKSYQKFLANDQREPFVNSEIKADEVYTDYSQGAMRVTNGNLDCCINGTGFFSVMTPNGVQYSRNGSFSLDANSLLVTSDGSKVLGRDGYIQIDKRYPVTINTNGEVVQNSTIKGVLKVVDFPKPYKLSRNGESCFTPTEPDTKPISSAGYVVRQGYLEASNVSAIRCMVEMISAYRSYEADSKALQTQDSTLDKAVNSVGKV